MLEAEHVTFQYLGAEQPSIRDANAILADGTINLVWGDNGAGKSTLALALCGAIPLVIKGQFSGAVLWNGAAISQSLLPRLCAFIFQDPYLYFSGHTIATEIDFDAAQRSSLWQGIQALLPDAPPDRPLHRLSVGEQQRVALCSALLRSTPLMLLDEPFEFLDRSGIDVATTLLSLASQSRTVVIIHRRTHQLEGLTINRGFRVIDGIVAEELPAHDGELPRLTSPSCHASHPPKLVVEGLSFAYPGRAMAPVRSVSLTVGAAESVGLVGPNGCGKTTLFLLMSGLLRPERGHVFIGLEEVAGRRLRRRVRCVFQNPDNQLFGTTVRDELEFSVASLRLRKAEVDARVESAGSWLPFPMSADPLALSFGQKKLLAIVGALIARPDVLLLDEPFAGLDSKASVVLRGLVADLLNAGGSVMVSAHDTAAIRSICSRSYVMAQGHIATEA